MPRSRSEAEALERLRERLQATQQAATKLADEAAAERDAARAGDDRPPLAGWDVPRRAEDANSEIEALIALLQTLRDVLPPELRAQLAELVRALLVFVRAVLDWSIERLALEDRRGDDPDVEDIPIG
jgi:hypothetical protein